MGCVARPPDCAQTARLFVRPAKIGRFGDVDKIVLVETSVTNSRRGHHFRRCRRIVMLDSRQNGEPARGDGTPPAHIIRPSRRHFHGQSIQFLSPNSSIKSVSQNYMFKYKFHLHSIGDFSDGRQWSPAGFDLTRTCEIPRKYRWKQLPQNFQLFTGNAMTFTKCLEILLGDLKISLQWNSNFVIKTNSTPIPYDRRGYCAC